VFEAILVLIVFGLLALLLGLSRWLARRPWAAAGNALVGLTLLLLAHRLWPAVTYLQTYEPLPAHGMIAQVYCERTGPRRYRLTLTRLPAGHMQVYELAGDEWRLDARTLAWKGYAAQVGLQPGFRLERLSARYLRPEAEEDGEPVAAAPASYSLSDRDAGEDVWAQARTATRWERQVDPRHALGPWRPLADGARYDVWMTGSSSRQGTALDATPGNEAAAKAMLYTRANNKVRSQG
jgi:hypothetical protein